MFATQNGIVKPRRTEKSLTRRDIESKIIHAHPTVKPLTTVFSYRDGKLAFAEWWPVSETWTIIGED